MAKKSLTKKTTGTAAAKKSVNKSAEIRAYLSAHPTMKLADVAAALTKKGIKVDAQYISVVKSAAKKKAAMGAGPGPGRPPKRTALTTAGAAVSVDSLRLAKKLISDVGGVAEAKKALDVYGELMH